MGVVHVICTVNMNRSVKVIAHWNSIKSTVDKQKETKQTKTKTNTTNKKQTKN